jgi:hypothetical protein
MHRRLALSLLLAAACSPSPPAPSQPAPRPPTNLQGFLLELPDGARIDGSFERGNVDVHASGWALAVGWMPDAMPTRETFDASVKAALAGVATEGGSMESAAAGTAFTRGGAVGWTVPLRGVNQRGTYAYLFCDRRVYTLLELRPTAEPSRLAPALERVACTPDGARSIRPAALADVIPGWWQTSHEKGNLMLDDESGAYLIAFAIDMARHRPPGDIAELAGNVLRTFGIAVSPGTPTIERGRFGARPVWRYAESSSDGDLASVATAFLCDAPAHLIIAIGSGPPNGTATRVEAMMATLRCPGPDEPAPRFPDQPPSP